MTTYICPVTRSKTLNLVPSRVRNGVMIAPESVQKEQHLDKWWVDSVEATKALKSYFKLLDDYDYLQNCSGDTKAIERMGKRVATAREKRKVKFVVFVQSEDGAHVLAEFVDLNHARARVFGWLGQNYDNYGENRWVSQYGSVISIIRI